MTGAGSPLPGAPDPGAASSDATPLAAILADAIYVAAETRWRSAFRDVPSAQGDVLQRGFILCHTPRAGSWMLASLMTATGVMGRPGEAFNPLHIPDARAADFDDYVRRACLKGATQNGLFAVKANFRQLAPFLRAGAIPGRYDWRYLYLTREDLVLQGVSLHRAYATRSWRSDQPEAGVAVFDEAAIWARVSELAEMMRAWELLFATLGVAPLRITYEQLALDRRAVLRAVARHGDVSIADDDLARDVPYVRQRTDENELWARMLVPGRPRRPAR